MRAARRFAAGVPFVGFVGFLRPLLPIVFLLPAAPVCAAMQSGGSEEHDEVFDSSGWGSVLGPLPPGSAAPGLSLDETTRLQVAEKFEAARRLLLDSRYVEAALAFEELLSLAPWPEARYDAALARYQAGDYAGALGHAEAAVAELGASAAPRHLLGVLLHALGRYEDAVATFQGLLENARRDERGFEELLALLNLGSSYRLLGRPDDALRTYADARSRASASGEPQLLAAAWLGEGFVHAVLGDGAAAERAWAQARQTDRRARMDSAGLESDLALARLERDAGNLTRARKYLASAAGRLAPLEDPHRRAAALLQVADLERDLGDESAALARLSEAEGIFGQAGIDVGRADALALRGGWAMERGDLDAAESDLLAAMGLQETLQVPLARAAAGLNLAQVRLGQGRLDEARALAEASWQSFRGARAATHERDALHVLAAVQQAAGRRLEAVESARASLEVARRIGDASAEAREHAELAMALAQAGQVEAAQAELDRIPRGQQSRVPAHVRARAGIALADAMRGAGRLPEALAESERALAAAREAAATDPALLASAREMRVLLLSTSGRHEDAGRFLQSEGIDDERLHAMVRDREAVDAFNRGLDAFNRGEIETALAEFGRISGDRALDPDRRAAARQAEQVAWMDKARRAQAAQDLPGARAALEHAVAIAQERHDVDTELEATLHLSRVHARAGDVRGSAERARQAIEIASQSTDARGLGEAYTLLGDARFDEHPDESRDAYQKALLAWGSAEPALADRARVTYNLAVLDWGAGRADDARRRMGEARVLAERAGSAALVQTIDELLPKMQEVEDDDGTEDGDDGGGR